MMARMHPDDPLGAGDGLAVRRLVLRAWKGLALGEQTFEVAERVHHSQLVPKSPVLGHLWVDGTLHWDGECGCHLVVPAALAQSIGAEPGSEAAQLAWEAVVRLQREQLDQNLRTCRCGINAFTRRRHLLGTEYGAQDIVAEIEISGVVRTFERGYRAERGRIVRMYSTREHTRAMVQAMCKRMGIEYAGHLGWWRTAHVLAWPTRS
jgi:hypothetical protein